MLSWCIEHLFAVGLIFGHKLFQRYPFSLLLAFGLAILAIVPPTADGIASFLQARLRPQYRIPKDNVAIITDDLLVPLVNPKEYPLSCLGRSEFLCQIRVFVLFGPLLRGGVDRQLPSMVSPSCRPRSPAWSWRSTTGWGQSLVWVCGHSSRALETSRRWQNA